MDSAPLVIVHNSSMQDHVVDKRMKDRARHSANDACLSTNITGVIVCGFVADFVRELQSQMGFNYRIDIADSRTDYHSLAASLSTSKDRHDIVISSIRITSKRLQIVDFSTPILDSTFRIIVRQNSYSHSENFFSFFNPFTADVWAAFALLIVYSGVIIYISERPHVTPGVAATSKWQADITHVCQALCSVVVIVGNVRPRSYSSRLIVLALYTLGVILMATYTARLSSSLTITRAQPLINGIDDIRNGRVAFTRIGIVNNTAMSDYFIQNVSSDFYPLSTFHEMYLRLLDNTIDASIVDASMVDYTIQNFYCNQLALVGVPFLKSSFGVVVPNNWLYKTDLDRHILALRSAGKLDAFRDKYLKPSNCSSTANKAEMDEFSLEVMGGIFLIFILLTVLAGMSHLRHYRVAFINTVRRRLRRR